MGICISPKRSGTCSDYQYCYKLCDTVVVALEAGLMKKGDGCVVTIPRCFVATLRTDNLTTDTLVQDF